MYIALKNIIIFRFHHKQCASNEKASQCFTFLKFSSEMFSSADKSLNDETLVLRVLDGSPVTMHTYNICDGASALFISRSRVSKSHSLNEFCYQNCIYLLCLSSCQQSRQSSGCRYNMAMILFQVIKNKNLPLPCVSQELPNNQIVYNKPEELVS